MKTFLQSVMFIEAVTIGLGITLAAYWINRKVFRSSDSEMKVWYGWVVALVLRFLGLIASGIYIAVVRTDSANTRETIWFLLTVLGVILAGLIIDLVLSIARVGKMNKAGY